MDILNDFLVIINNINNTDDSKLILDIDRLIKNRFVGIILSKNISQCSETLNESLVMFHDCYNQLVNDDTCNDVELQMMVVNILQDIVREMDNIIVVSHGNHSINKPMVSEDFLKELNSVKYHDFNYPVKKTIKRRPNRY